MKKKQNYFEEKGDEYSRYRPTYPEELAVALAERCYKSHHVLEVGCGTGQLSGVLSKKFDAVTATDPSAEQIKNATPYNGVSYQQGTAEDICLPDQDVDLVVAAQAAHWFDLPTFYEQVKKIGNEHSLLALISYGVLSLEGDIGERFAEFYWKEIHQFWPPERKHIEQGYQSFDFPFEEQSLPELYIYRSWTTAELLGYVETWSAVRVARKLGNGDIIDGFSREISALCPDETQTNKIQWPIVGRLGKIH